MKIQSVSSVAQSCPTLCNPMNRSTSGLPVHHQLPEFTQTHVHWVGDAIQPSHPLSTPFPPAFNLSLHQGLFQWLGFLHQVAKVLEFQLQHQSFQWTPRTDLLYDGLVGSPCSPRDSQESSPRVFSNTTVCKLIYFKTFFSYTLHARLVTSVMLKLCETPWTIAHQASLSMGFSRQEYWSGLPSPPLGDLPDLGAKPTSLTSNLHWQAGSLPPAPPGKPSYTLTIHSTSIDSMANSNDELNCYLITASDYRLNEFLYNPHSADVRACRMEVKQAREQEVTATVTYFKAMLYKSWNFCKKNISWLSHIWGLEMITIILLF